MNFQDHIQRYLRLVSDADTLFKKVSEAHPSLMTCRTGCDDCCSVYYQLTLIEAFYVNGMFRAGASGPQFAAAMARAAESERRFSEMRGLLAHADPDKTDVLEMAAKFRVPCPLKQDHVCMLYESRPITCRVYGAPQQIGSRVVSCPKTGFEPGRSYTTVNMAEIQRRLAAASGKFLADMLGMRIKSGAPLYSLPEALRTEFNRDYFLKLKAALS